MRYCDARRAAVACPLTGTPRAVFFALVTHLGPHGDEAWPSHDWLAAILGVTDRTVRAAMRALEQAGVVVRTGRRCDGNLVYRVPDADRFRADDGDRHEPEDFSGSGEGGNRKIASPQPEAPSSIKDIRYISPSLRSGETRARTRDGAKNLEDEDGVQDQLAALGAGLIALQRQVRRGGRRPDAAPRAAPPPGATRCPWLDAAGAPDVSAMLADPAISAMDKPPGLTPDAVRHQAERFIRTALADGRTAERWDQRWWLWINNPRARSGHGLGGTLDAAGAGRGGEGNACSRAAKRLRDRYAAEKRLATGCGGE